MRRLWVRWLCLLVFVAVLGTVFVTMGDWQLRRLDQRQQRNVATTANEAKPVVGFERVFDAPIKDADQWQRVEARGEFIADNQLLVRYRNNNDASGYEVVTPLRTTSGVTLMVDRGFVAVEKGNQIPLAAPAPPTGLVTVIGHVRRNEEGRKGALHPVSGQMRLINAPAIAATLPYPIVVNGYISALTVDPSQGEEFVAVAVPELSDGPHFWYAVQWFMFTGIGVLGLVVFIRGDIRVRREDAGSDEAKEPTPASTGS